MKKTAFSLCFVAAMAAMAACGEVQVINGRAYECADGVCRLVGADAGDEAPKPSAETPRIAQGYMSAERFVAFLENRTDSDGRPFGDAGALLTLLLVLLGGLALNLTPCVLPMIPVNLLVIGKSATRGLLYGLGIAIAYGALGVAAAVGGLAFGTIQSSPWFNAAVSVVFAALALAFLGATLPGRRVPYGNAQRRAGRGVCCADPCFGASAHGGRLCARQQACASPAVRSWAGHGAPLAVPRRRNERAA